MNKKILVIDDDEKLLKLLGDYLERFNYKVLTAPTPHSGMEKLRKDSPDLIILDVMLPGKNGFDVCKDIRKESSVPVIMLTARGDVMDRIIGLEIGADDYLSKPFEPRELAARIQSVLRRSEEKSAVDIINYGNIFVDLNKQIVTLNGLQVDLTSMEFTILSILMKNPYRVLSRDRIMEALKGMDWDAYDRSIDVLISRLRQKLNDDPRNPEYIKTIRGTGYRFIGGEIEKKS